MVLPVFVIHEDQRIAVHAIGGQNDHHDEIRNQQQQVKAIGRVQALKSLVEIMGAEIVQQPALRGSHKKNAGTNGIQEALRKSLGMRTTDFTLKHWKYST